MKGIHGGDIYHNCVNIDFSVNGNPLGMPKAVESALHEAVRMCRHYPDISNQDLKKAVSGMLKIPKENLLFGNGASELFMAVVHGLQPRRVLIPVPSFYGYEYAADAAGGTIIFYLLGEENGYLPGDDFIEMLTEDTDLLFLGNPNNPTGRLFDQSYLREILRVCRQKKIIVVLDECFIEFCKSGFSMVSEISEYENLLIVRAFTKIFAIPGVRVGYLTGSNVSLLNKIKKHLPEWNLSVFAQAAGMVCTKQQDFIRETVHYIKEERRFLSDRLKREGLRVFLGEANFILVYSEKLLYESLLEQGILIRDCSNFRGLSKGFYRIAVKSREENEILIKAVEKI